MVPIGTLRALRCPFDIPPTLLLRRFNSSATPTARQALGCFELTKKTSLPAASSAPATRIRLRCCAKCWKPLEKYADYGLETFSRKSNRTSCRTANMKNGMPSTKLRRQFSTHILARGNQSKAAHVRDAPWSANTQLNNYMKLALFPCHSLRYVQRRRAGIRCVNAWFVATNTPTTGISNT